MNPTSSENRFRKILFWFATIFLSVHILLGALCILSPTDFLPSKLNSIYSKLVILGPFFTDDRITTSPHLFVSTFTIEQGWSPFRDDANKTFSDFLHYPWKYNGLKWTDYERYIVRKANSEIDTLKYINGSEGKASIELIKYVSKSQQASKADSIHLLYLWNVWRPETQSVRIDTAFNVVFKP